MAVKNTESPEPGGKKKAENRFRKGQLLAAERFRKNRDLVDALLSPDKEYTVGEVEKMVADYKKGKVE